MKQATEYFFAIRLPWEQPAGGFFLPDTIAPTAGIRHFE